MGLLYFRPLEQHTNPWNTPEEPKQAGTHQTPKPHLEHLATLRNCSRWGYSTFYPWNSIRTPGTPTLRSPETSWNTLNPLSPTWNTPPRYATVPDGAVLLSLLQAGTVPQRGIFHGFRGSLWADPVWAPRRLTKPFGTLRTSRWSHKAHN